MLGAIWKPIVARQGEDRSPKPTLLSVVLVFFAAVNRPLKKASLPKKDYLHLEFTPVVAILVPISACTGPSFVGP
jgi:hypothetical protein